jgi:hypothetical protein
MISDSLDRSSSDTMSLVLTEHLWAKALLQLTNQMEEVKLHDFLFGAGVISGLVLIVTFYLAWFSKQPIDKGRIIFFRLLLGMTALLLVGAGYLKSAYISL